MLQTPYLYYRVTVELNNHVVSLWKQELTHVKNNKIILFLTTHVFWCFSKVVWILNTVSDIIH